MIGKYDDFLQLKGGKFVKIFSVLDPNGSFYVQCDLHPDYWEKVYASYDPFDSRFSGTRESFLHFCQRILNNCPKCHPPFDYANSRFPEGAEL